METSTRIDAPTPAGGDYSIAYWMNAEGKPCDRSDATQAEIVEYSASGEVVQRTYGAVTQN